MGILVFGGLLFVLLAAILSYVLVAFLVYRLGNDQLKWLLKSLGILILVLFVFLVGLFLFSLNQIVFY